MVFNFGSKGALPKLRTLQRLCEPLFDDGIVFREQSVAYPWPKYDCLDIWYDIVKVMGGNRSFPSQERYGMTLSQAIDHARSVQTLINYHTRGEEDDKQSVDGNASGDFGQVDAGNAEKIWDQRVALDG